MNPRPDLPGRGRGHAGVLRTGVAVLLLGLVAVLALRVGGAVSVAAGRELYRQCEGCHSLDRDRTGPRHCGLFGRRAGSVAGFDFSPAMRASGIVWNAATLERFLAAPTEVVPGTRMTWAGLHDAAQRRDIVAYLRHATAGADCR